jgi:subtilisin family serine protease
MLFLLLGLLSFWGMAFEKTIPPERAIPSLESALQILAEAADPRLFPESLDLFRDGLVQVVVEGDYLEEEALSKLGGVIRFSVGNLWEVLIPPKNLPKLSALPGVRYVRRPARPFPANLSQGVNLTGASQWHAWGITGKWIRVAVIDLEFGGLSQAIAEGRLKRVIAVRDYTGKGLESGGGHGVACAEIVQDMAPDAELILLKIDTEVQLHQAVRDAIAMGARIISHSAGWFNTNFYDGTGIVCDAVRYASEQGVLWVNSAGNHADGPHWEGEWHDYDGDGLLDFAPGVNVNTFSVSALNPVGIWLTWDGWPVTSEDFDLYVVHMPSGMTVASSTNTQDGRQPPTEYVFFVPPFPGTYGIVVKAASITQPLRLEIFCTTNVRLSYAVAESSIVAPADSPFSLSVGAVAASQWPSGPQEPYSSRGPTNKSRLNPLSLTKPDLMGPDRVDTWTYGGEGFPGTSASAPHVAGAAALVWSAHPAWNAEQVRVWLEYAALDLGEKGKDNVYGAGLLRLLLPAVPSPGKSHTYGARAGWYLVSVPTSGDTAGIFGVPLYGWNGVSYTVLTGAAPLEPTKGYWAKLPANATVTASGTVPTTDQTVPLVKGWNLISVPWPYPKAKILVIKGAEQKSWAEAVALGWVREAIWGYDGVYTSVSSLDPWSGYWLYARVEGLSLRLRAGTPPSPPTEASGFAPADAPPPPPGEEPPAGLRVTVAPNPITDVQSAVFRVLGPLAAQVTEIRVRVYDLSGRLVWAGSAKGAELAWHTEDFSGQPLANGVYFYQVEACVAGEWLPSSVQKLVIFR